MIILDTTLDYSRNFTRKIYDIPKKVNFDFFTFSLKVTFWKLPQTCCGRIPMKL